MISAASQASMLAVASSQFFATVAIAVTGMMFLGCIVFMLCVARWTNSPY